MYKRTVLPFCSLFVKDNILVAEINEGVHVDKKLSDEINFFNLFAFNNEPYVYITNRINSYSVDPTIYKNVSKNECLKGFAVVSKSTSAKNAEVERLFLKKPFEIFDNLKDAEAWARNLLNK